MNPYRLQAALGSDPKVPAATGAEPKVLGFYSYLRITDEHPEEMPDAVITMHDIPVCTRKSLTLLSGDSKAGKSAVTSVLCAGAIRTANGFDGCAAIQVAYNGGQQAVLHVDTEQSRYHHYRNFKNAIKRRALIDKAPEYFYSYNIRQLALSDYRVFLDSLFSAAHELHDGIQFAVIDGVADFIKSVNDEMEANQVVHYFEQLAIKYDTAIILVLHFNPGTGKERGHLGSQLQRKCESVLSVTKENDTSTLEAKLLRGGSTGQFSPIHFQFDTHKGYHVFLDAGEVKEDLTALTEFAAVVFNERRKYSEAIAQIEDKANCSKATAKRRLTAMLENDIIEKAEDGNNSWYSLKYDVPF